MSNFCIGSVSRIAVLSFKEVFYDLERSGWFVDFITGVGRWIEISGTRNTVFVQSESVLDDLQNSEDAIPSG